MKFESSLLPITRLELNAGQLYGLPKNPRFIKDERFEALKKSIKDAPEMLNLRELLVYPLENGNYIIIGGNMRFRACKELGIAEIPCKILPKETPVQKLREYTIKDNEGFGSTDWDIIANEFDMAELADWGMDLTFLEGGDDFAEDNEHAEAREDDFDENVDAIQVRCKRGDVWQLGEHRLMCGDSVDLEDVKRLMGGVMADMWITDPPYNVAYEGKTKDKLTIKNDKMESNAFYQFLYDAFNAACENIKNGASFYVWFASREHINFEKALVDNGMPIREELIWCKNTFVFGRQDYQWQHEPCLYGWKEGASHNWYSDRSQTTIMNFNKPARNGEHPTMKPVELFAYQIKNSSKPNDVVLDSFGGSGTTLIACEQLGRKARVMELDPHYCDVILARWEKLTGKEAIKCDTKN